MIYFLTKVRHDYTILPLIDEWGDEAAALLQPLSYEKLLLQKAVPFGVYVFADIERLSPPMMNAVVKIADRIETQWGSSAVRNHPRRVMLRYQLLTSLNRIGVNDYRVYYAGSWRNDCRFPVFLRCANDHRGSLSGLLNTEEELRQALRRALLDGAAADQLLVTEYCDTRSEDGWYRKYAAFVVGDRVIPRHIAFHREWMVKLHRSGSRDHLEEEEIYIESNPHKENLLKIFRHGGIDYGRMDYSLKNGKIQVWEINTNPTVIRSQGEYDGIYLDSQKRFVTEMENALKEIDAACERGSSTGEISGFTDIADILSDYSKERFLHRINKHAIRILPRSARGYWHYLKLR